MASVPSRMALATSDASARVGRGLSIMLSSIWVAVITTLPAPLAAAMIRFWSVGTSSVESSTPRSPRATMTPSAASSIVGQVVDGLALLDLGDDGHGPAQGADEGLRFLDVRGLAHEGEGHVVDAILHAEREVAPVFFGERGGRELHSRQVHALAALEQAAVEHAGENALALHALDLELEVAVVEEDAVPRAHVARQGVVGGGDELARPHHRLVGGDGQRGPVPELDPVARHPPRADLRAR